MVEGGALCRFLFDEAPDGILIFDNRGQVVDVNRRGLDLTGYSRDELLGLEWNGLFAPEAASPDLHVRTGRGERVPAARDSHLRRKDGSQFPVELNVRKGPQGRLFAVVHDDTERRRAEEALRRSEVFARSIIENEPECVKILGPGGILRYMNPAGLAMIEVEKLETVVGQCVFPIVAEEYRAAFIGLTERVLGGGTGTLQFEIVGFKGTRRRLETHAVPLMDELGKAEGLLGLTRDITERTRSEEERSRLQDQLIHAERLESVGRLAGGVAHDFNNMLGVILGNLELAMLDLDPKGPLHARLEDAHLAAQRSADLTRQLLAFARKQAVTPKVIDLNTTLDSMLKMIRRLIGEGIELVWKPGKELQPLRIDPVQIDQILANLCLNARDAIQGVGRVTIETTTATIDEGYCAEHIGFVPGEFVVLSVSDDGIGMSQEVLAHLFEPFFTTKGMGKGTGLGLASVYGVVRQNSGFINVYSEVGHGTVFKIFLPIYRGAVEAAPKPESEAPGKHGGGTILLVEDDPAFLKTSQKILEGLGYTVMAAHSPGEALRLAEAYRGEIHLLMTDVVMPEMNGPDLARKMASLFPNLKRLFVSGYSGNVIDLDGALLDGDAFLQKPFSMKELGAKVLTILGRS